MSDLELFYKKEISKIEKCLKGFSDGKDPDALYKPISYLFQKNGKLLRPLLVLLSAKSVGGNYENVKNAAVSVELAHASSLVHDDMIDNSNKRRGRLSLHKVYGRNASLLVGDALIFASYESLLKDCTKKTKEILTLFTLTAVKICEGQSLDMDFDTKKEVSIEEYKIMIYKKTAALLEVSCMIGAKLSCDDEKLIKAVSNYGKFLGLAFQIQDDLLDISADEVIFGKKIGTDFLNGKKTYISLRFYEVANQKERSEVFNLLKSKKTRSFKVNFFKNICSRLGVFVDSEAEIKKYINLALRSIECLPESEGKEMMILLAEKIKDRKF